MTKRILALLLAVLLGVSCFALTACGGEETEKKDDPKDPVTQPPETQTPPPESNVTPPPADVPPTLQLFTTEATLIIGEETWDFASNSFVMNHETLTFTSSDDKVATVDENGLVTPVAEGTATITIVAAAGDLTAEATLALTVKKPFEPTRPEDIEIFGIMRGDATKYETYGNYLVGMADDSKYNELGLTGMTNGPVEIWQDTLQLLFTMDTNEVDASAGIGQDGYNFFFDLYYKPYDAATEKEGGYKKATIQAWSVYKFDDPGKTIYRCTFGNTDLMDLEEGKYTVQIVVREGEQVKGWMTAIDFNWTDATVNYIEYAKAHPDEVATIK